MSVYTPSRQHGLQVTNIVMSYVLKTYIIKKFGCSTVYRTDGLQNIDAFVNQKVICIGKIVPDMLQWSQ